MPKLKEHPEIMQDKQLRGKVAEKMSVLGYDNKADVAERLGINPRTFYYKLADPDKFSRRELRRLFQILKFSDEEKSAVV
ncbi:helix-turn-helix domain-containing protein [Anaerovorax sp. IOR16]|uniref:helix-turn-helix domain-containing protein n=1 Tax=Anaerovorax sp. IOR16 TaxID=2773458 RepID=UPI0019CF9A5A|nr:helix-turn-helix domain-containing protein [Anaerovorax sp. IOR16]